MIIRCKNGILLVTFWFTYNFFICQLMVSGDHGANGPFVLRPVEGDTQERPELVPTQHLRMVAVPVKEPTSRRKVVTSSSAQVMIIS